jgi:hypothetical protein
MTNGPFFYISGSLRKVFGLRQEQPVGRTRHLAAEVDDGVGARKRKGKTLLKSPKLHSNRRQLGKNIIVTLTP